MLLPSTAESPPGEQDNQEQQRSVGSHGHPTAQLARFVVDAAVLGTGVLRPLTFFPVVTTIASTDSSMYRVPDVPVGPHQRSLDTGVRRNQWAVSSSAHVDRRYSELVDFRTLLAFQFPTIIVPPLPPKSKFDNFGTFLTNENILLAQQRSIVRFLREVAMTPELIYFSVYTPNFFQLPRESFEDWVGSMRSAIEDFRHCNASIDAYSTRKGKLLGSDSVTTFTDGSTKVVRKIVGMLHSWIGSDAPKPEVHENKQRHHNQEQQGRQSAAVGAGGYVNVNEEDHLLYWTSEMRFLTSYRDAILEAARPYLAYMEHSMEVVIATKDTAEALERCSRVLGASASNEEISSAMKEVCVFTSDAAKAVEGQQIKNKREVYERLLFELAYIDSALDAIDHVLCLWRFCREAMGEVACAARKAYAGDVSEKLRVYYEQRFLRNFRRRMHNMISRMADTGLHYAKVTVECMKNSAFMKRVQDENYLVYNA